MASLDALGAVPASTSLDALAGAAPAKPKSTSLDALAGGAPALVAPHPLAPRKPFETPPNGRENPLRTIGAVASIAPSIFDAAYESVPFLNAPSHPAGNYLEKLFDAYKKGVAATHSATGGFEAANEQFDPLGNPVLEREGVKSKHVDPWSRGIGELAVNWYNPANEAFSLAARGAGAAAKKGSAFLRAVSPAAEYAATAAEHGVAQAQKPVVDAVRAAAKKASDVVTGVEDGVRGAVDRYFSAGLPQRGGGGYTGQAFRMQAAAAHAENTARDYVRKLGDGLTTAQKREVQKLMYQDTDGQLLYKRPSSEPPAPAAPPEIKVGDEVPFGDTTRRVKSVSKMTINGETTIGVTFHGDPQSYAYEPPAALPREAAAPSGPVVPQPKGMTLEARAEALRKFRADTDAQLSALNIRDTKKNPLFSTGMYFPMRRFLGRDGKPVPVFANDDLEKAAADGDETLLNQQMARRGGGKFAATAAKTGKKVDPTATIIDPDIEADLHPQYDPFFQLEEHYADAHRNIANETTRRELEHTPSIDPATGEQRTYSAADDDARPAMARVPVQYHMPDPTEPTQRIVFGEGTAGRTARDAYADRIVNERAARAARSDPEMQAFAKARGVDPADLGTHGVVSRGTLPDLERLRAAKRMSSVFAKGVERIKGAASDAAPSLDDLGRVGSDVSASADNLGATLSENAERASSAKDAARSARDLADEADAQARELATTTPRKLTADLARQLRDEAEERTAGVREFVQRGSDRQGLVVPSYVWDGKTWKVAGEYANVPEKFLDTSTKPTQPPYQTSGLVARVDGNLDDIASQSGMSEDELLRWMETNGQRPRIADFVDEAAERVAASKHADPAEIEDLRGYAAQMRALSSKAAREHEARSLANTTFGPAVRSAVNAGKRAQGDLGDIAENIKAGIGKTAERVTSNADKLESAVNAFEADAAAKLDRRRDVTAVAKEFQKVTQRYWREMVEDVRSEIREKSAHAPDGGYVLESSVPGLESPSRQDKAIDEAFARYLTASKTLAPDEVESAKGIWRTLDTFNQIARAGIVAVPTVHAVFNMGINYLAEGGDIETMAKILAGQYRAPDLVAQRAFNDGAATETSQHLFELGNGANRTTDIGERAGWAAAKAGPFAPAVKPLAQAAMTGAKAYNGINRWLFKTVEQGYAIDLHRLKTSVGTAGPQAAIETRSALGRYDNVTPRELANNLNRLFYFYPWMKTVLAFWTKKGLFDPKWVNAPVAAIKTNNEAQGYDDPSKPFTGTFGRRADGSFRRMTVPLPQRVTENVAELARTPFDAVGSLRGKQPWTDALADLAAPINYVQGHFNPLISTGIDLAQAAAAAKGGGRASLAPWNAFATDSKATPQENTERLAAGLAGKAFAPIDRLKDAKTDPLGTALNVGAGMFSYGVQPAAEKKREHAVRAYLNSQIREPFKDALDAAVKSGDKSAETAIRARIAALEAARKPLIDAAVAHSLQQLRQTAP